MVEKVKRFHNAHRESGVIISSAIEDGCKENIRNIFDIIDYQKTATLAKEKFIKILERLEKQNLVSFVDGDQRKFNIDESLPENDVRRKTISPESGTYFKNEVGGRSNFTLQFNREELNKHFNKDIVPDIKNLIHGYSFQFSRAEDDDNRKNLAEKLEKEFSEDI